MFETDFGAKTSVAFLDAFVTRFRAEDSRPGGRPETQKARKLLQDFFAQAGDPGVEKHESDAVSAKVPLLIALAPLPRPRGPDSCLLSLHLQPLEFSGLQRRPGRGIAHRFGRD